MKPQTSQWSELQLDQKLESPYRSPFFVPSFIHRGIEQLLGLQYSEKDGEDIEGVAFGANNHREHTRAHLQHIAVTILLATKLLSLRDASANGEFQSPQSPICKECQNLNLGRIFLFRTQKINTTRQFRHFQEGSSHCSCCKFIYESLVAEVAVSKVTSIEKTLDTKVSIRSSEAFWHEIIFALGSDIWAPEARITPVYLGTWPASWPKSWTPTRAISSTVCSDSTPEQKARVLFDWVRACASHPECQKGSAATVLPDRVLDVDASQTSIRLREHEPGTNSSRYIALSYCWGNKPQICLTASTVDELKEGFALASLPQTIQDAVYLTRKLGCRYLWIDALCIFQDDSKDWEKQSSKMGTVYKNAYLTLQASRAASVHDGFLGSRPPNEVYCGSMSHKGYAKNMYLSKGYGYGTLEDFLKSEPLSLRAWAMQERALSRRKVFFGMTKMIWQCRQVAVTEQGIEISDETQSALITDANASNHSLWLKKISRYSRLSLTKPSDRLPAVSGLASEFRGGANDVYLAGHWQSSFIVSLLWNTNTGANLKQSDQLCAPSWSWASINGPIDYLPNTILKEKATDSIQPIAKLLEHKIDLSDTNPFGEVRSGYIDLQAPSLRIKLSDLRYKRESRTETGFFEAFGLRKEDFTDLSGSAPGQSKRAVGIYFDLNSLEVVDVAGLVARCIILGRREHRALGTVLCGMIVIPTSPDNKSFRRIGMFDEMFDVVNRRSKFTRIRIV